VKTEDRAGARTAPEEAAGNADVGRRRVIVHPLLMAVNPVLFLYSHNMHELNPAELLLPAGLALASAGILWCLLSAILRNGARAALLSSFFWLWFFSCGHANALLTRTVMAQAPYLASARFFLIPYGVLLAAGTYVILRQRRECPALHVGLNVMCVLLFVWHVGAVGNCEWRRAVARQRLPQAVPIRASRPMSPGQPPTIYYIVLDGYARADVLSDLYGLDNSDLLGFLEERGFHVSRESRANYCQTLLSLASTLNLTYLDELAAATGSDTDDRQLLIESIADNRLCRFLRSRGYGIAESPSGYGPIDLAHPDLRLDPLAEAPSTSRFSEFQRSLFDTTPIAFVLDLPFSPTGGFAIPSLVPRGPHVQRVEHALEHLPDAAKLTGPLFVFAHIICPHPPFLFTRDGPKPTGPNDPFAQLFDGSHFAGTSDEYRRSYREQVLFVNSRIKPLVDRILRESGGTAVIVIASDHGPGSRLDWESAADTDMRERLANLLAYYLPGDPRPGTDEVVTPVNVFRLVLNRYVGTDLEMLPDESYYSTSSHPYRFVRVTDKLETKVGAKDARPRMAVGGPPRSDAASGHLESR
jgi:hypothetical protein